MDIILSNSPALYFPGNKVSGRVLFTLQMETQVRGITMEVRGEEHACFAARRKYYDSTENKMKYEGGSWMGGVRYNNFLEVDLTISGRNNLNPGRHELPINFPLSKDLPTSFQGKYGFVRYYIRVKVDVIGGHDFEGEEDFEVQSFIDFNEIISDLQMSPVTYQKETSLGFCCCTSGPITMDVRLNKIAFVSGEMAKIKVDVANFSDENVIKILVKLTRTVKSRLEQRQRDFFRYEHEDLSSNFDIGVPAGGQNSYDFDLEVPRSAVIYNFKRCMFLCQWFTLSVEAVLVGYNENLKIETKVELGHIPLGGNCGEQLDLVQETSHLASTEPASRRPISPPPTYNDAVKFFPASPGENLVGKHAPSAPRQ